MPSHHAGAVYLPPSPDSGAPFTCHSSLSPLPRQGGQSHSRVRLSYNRTQCWSRLGFRVIFFWKMATELVSHSMKCKKFSWTSVRCPGEVELLSSNSSQKAFLQDAAGPVWKGASTALQHKESPARSPGSQREAGQLWPQCCEWQLDLQGSLLTYTLESW